jgi:hypothetical protein
MEKLLIGPKWARLWRSYDVRISSGLICGESNGGRDRDRTGDPCLQISVAASQLFGISNVHSVSVPLFGEIRAVLEQFRYDLCTNTWLHLRTCESVSRGRRSPQDSTPEALAARNCTAVKHEPRA